MAKVCLVSTDRYAEIIMPAVPLMATSRGYEYCFNDLNADGCQSILKKNIDALASRDDVFLLADVDESGSVLGFLLGFVRPQWYSINIEGVQEFLWVYPEYRGGLTMLRLIKAFEKECRSRGAVTAQIGISSPEHMYKFARVAKRAGYAMPTIQVKKLIGRN